MKYIWFVMILTVLFLSSCGVFREIEEPSATLEAIPLEIEAAQDSEATQEETIVETVEDVPTPGPMQEPTAEPVEAPTDTPVAESTEASPGGVKIYSIVSEQSQVRFELDEDLRGNRITVIGSTDQVAGELALDLNDLSTTQVGIIQINARTLRTDNNFRNQAINNEILETGEYEFITFEPTGVEDLPDSAEVGEAIEFSIVGTLTIRDITQDVTFDVIATAVSLDQIVGSATTIISREEFDLNIPSVPSVANVEEEVELYIDFMASTIQ